MTDERNVFEYESIQARMALQTRLEKHGKENASATTLEFAIDCPNTILNYLQDGLMQALYRGDVDPQADLDTEHLPTVRFPAIPYIKWPMVCTHHEVSILGPGGRNPITLSSCELKEFKFVCKQGGTVELTFKCNCHPEPDQVSTLYKHNGKLVEFKVVAEEIEPPLQADLEDASNESVH